MNTSDNEKRAPSNANNVAEIVALALNEQGYLFQHKIVQVLQSGDESNGVRHNWFVEAEEVPVSLPNSEETRIDMVLRHGPALGNPWRIVVECKRSSPEFKRWVFFGGGALCRNFSPRDYYVEFFDESPDQAAPNQAAPMQHLVKQVGASSECPVFDYGVEVKSERPETRRRASATNAIEDAFQQVILGQTGFALRLRKVCERSFRLLPVVVTTAELFSADFSVDRVSLDRGMLQPADLSLKPMSWLAVNYRINAVICELSGITTTPKRDLAADLLARQVRTVFVVQSAQVRQFLAWAGESFHCAARR